MICKAAQEMHRGLHDGDLGGRVFKKRIALAGGGKSGGARAIIVYQIGEIMFFIDGWAKALYRKREKKFLMPC